MEIDKQLEHRGEPENTVGGPVLKEVTSERRQDKTEEGPGGKGGADLGKGSSLPGGSKGTACRRAWPERHGQGRHCARIWTTPAGWGHGGKAAGGYLHILRMEFHFCLHSEFPT